MKLKSFIPLLVAAALGVAAFVVGKDMLKPQPGGQAKHDLKPVVVFSKDLEPGAMLQQEDLSISELPANVRLNGAMTVPGEAIGRVLTARVVKGQMLLSGMLAPVGTGSGLQALVPKGMRAVSVPINEVSGLSGLLVPGCRVDVVCIMEDRKTGQIIARTVVEDVQVSSVGQTLSMNSKATDDPSTNRSATLLVTPTQAEALALAGSQGMTRLILRSGDDSSTRESIGVTLAQLSGRKEEVVEPVAPVAPATQPVVIIQAPPPEPPHRTVQIIRGGNEDRLRFEESGAPMSNGPQNVGKSSGKTDVFSSN